MERKPADLGIEVEDMGDSGDVLGIVACTTLIFTTWRCPVCTTQWYKPGKHSGVLKGCKKCGAKFFLRHQSDGLS